MIELSGLTKRYADKVAVDNISFRVRPGAVTGFLGPNGAGKTTTMRMILGLAAPTSGRVEIDGRPYAALDAPLKKVGAMVDASAIDPRLTPAQYLDILTTASGTGGARIRGVLAAVGLAEAADKRIGEFSYGMRQRAGIAAALIGDPETVLMDEPFNGLDVDGIHRLRALLKDLVGQGKAVLVSSHLLSEVEEIADRIVVLARGALVADMPMAELRGRSAGSYVRVQSDDASALRRALVAQGAQVEALGHGALRVRGSSARRVGDTAFEKGLRVHELVAHQPSLEQLFAELVEGKTEYGGAAPGRESGAARR